MLAVFVFGGRGTFPDAVVHRLTKYREAHDRPDGGSQLLAELTRIRAENNPNETMLVQEDRQYSRLEVDRMARGIERG